MSSRHLLMMFAAMGGVTEIVTLSGLPGSPNMIIKPAGGLQVSFWNFTSNGLVIRDGVAFGIEWVNPKPPTNSYWIRSQANSGTQPSGPAPGVWHALSTNRTWEWTSNNVFLVGSIRIDIASDSGGTNILATGYYGAQFGT